MSLPSDFLQMMLLLTQHQVEYIVIGGVCGNLQGSPLVTRDLDIVHARTDANYPRILAALSDLQAYYRGRGTQRLIPKQEWLQAEGPHLLRTRLGDLDLLGTVSGNRGFEDLLPHTVQIQLADSVKVRVLDLPTLIRIKEETGRDKDKAALPILRATLAEQLKLQQHEKQ